MVEDDDVDVHRGSRSQDARKPAKVGAVARERRHHPDAPSATTGLTDGLRARHESQFVCCGEDSLPRGDADTVRLVQGVRDCRDANAGSLGDLVDGDALSWHWSLSKEGIKKRTRTLVPEWKRVVRNLRRPFGGVQLADLLNWWRGAVQARCGDDRTRRAITRTRSLGP